MRSKWKIDVLLKKLPQNSGHVMVYQRSARIVKEYVGRRFAIHTGRRFISLLIRNDHVGGRFGDFVATKKTGKIHKLSKAKAKKKGKK